MSTTDGTFSTDGVARAKWTIVEGSGTGGLKNLRGMGGYGAKHDGTNHVWLELEPDI